MANRPKKAGRLPYKEGDWFVVPLPGGGHATGLAARVAPTGRIVLGYFFGPRAQVAPDLAALGRLRPEHASFVARFGDLGLVEKRWRVLGAVGAWQRDKWPVPDFGRTTPIDGRAWRVAYGDDPSSRPRESPAAAGEVSALPKAGLFGAGAIEKVLDHKLDVASLRSQE